MTRLVLVLFLMLMAAPPLRAEVVPDLMRGEAVVTGRDDLEERARGVRVALTQVLAQTLPLTVTPAPNPSTNPEPNSNP